MKDLQRDRVRLLHIVGAAEKVARFMEKVESFDAFFANELLQSACIRELEIVGEASNHISKGLKERHYSTAWRKSTALRNFLIHEYYRIEPDLVWDTVQFHLPVFLEEIKTILSTLPTDDE